MFYFNNVFDEDGTKPRIADTPLPATRAEVIDAQRTDGFCQIVLARKSETKYSKFFEDDGGILRRKNPHHRECSQIVVPASLRPRILSLAHYHKLACDKGSIGLTWLWISNLQLETVMLVPRTEFACASEPIL